MDEAKARYRRAFFEWVDETLDEVSPDEAFYRRLAAIHVLHDIGVQVGEATSRCWHREVMAELRAQDLQPPLRKG